jgi:hypothetical protein
VPVTYVEFALSTLVDETALLVEIRGIPRDYLFAYGAGWHIHVEDLCTYLAGGVRRDADDAQWESLEELYRGVAEKLPQ